MEHSKLEGVGGSSGAIACVGRAAGRLPRVALGVCVLAAMLGLAAASSAADDVAALVDLNSASEAELTSLPGVGPAKAKAIIAYRETSPFQSPDELVEVKGIGEKLYAQLKDRVTVAAPGDGAPAAAGAAAGVAAGEQARAGRSAGAAGAH